MQHAKMSYESIVKGNQMYFVNHQHKYLLLWYEDMPIQRILYFVRLILAKRTVVDGFCDNEMFILG